MLDKVGLDNQDNISYYSAIEITTDGAQGTIVGVGRNKNGQAGYELLHYERSRDRGANFSKDGLITSEEESSILHHVDTVLQVLNSINDGSQATFIVLSAEYEDSPTAPALRAAVEKRFPKTTVQELTPELEAKANYLTMLGRTDFPLNEYALVDIGSNYSIFSAYDYPVSGKAMAFNVPYGTRSTYARVDPLGDLRLTRSDQRQRLERLVRDTTEVRVKKILREPHFASRDKIMFMGGFVYKIIRTLDIPMTGRSIDFSRTSEAELPAKFRALLQEQTADLKRGPNYSPEEMFAALVLLETIMDEYNDGQAAFFFERPTWLPGLILHNVLPGTQEADVASNPQSLEPLAN